MESIVTETLINEILAIDDLDRLVATHLSQLSVDEFAQLKASVDHLGTVDLKLASRLANAVWQLASTSGSNVKLAYGEAALARVEYCHGHYSQAEQHYQKALQLMEQLGRKIDVAILQKQLVNVLTYLGETQAALKLAGAARQVLRASQEQIQLAELETNIGNLYCYLLNQYARSLQYYQRAWQIFDRLQNEVSLARVEYNMANALTDLDRIDEALNLYQRAAVTYRKHGMSVFAGQAEYNIAYLMFRRGQFNDSLKYYYQVRERQQMLGDDVSVAWCNMDMAELYLQLSVYEESARLANCAHNSFLEFGNNFKAAWAQVLRGLALAGAGSMEQARRELGAALEIFSRQGSRVMVGHVHTYLADLELRAGRHQLALANAQAAERIFVAERLHTKVALARLLMAKLAYLTGNNQRARSLLRSVQQKAERYASPWLSYECHYLHGCLYQANGDKQAALTEFTKAIQWIGKTRSHLCSDELKSAFLRDKMVLFEQAIDLSLDDINDDQMVGNRLALDFVEQAKSRSLAELLAHYVERELAGQLAQPELRARFHTLLNELNWYHSANNTMRENNSVARNVNISEPQLQCERELTEIFRRLQLENDRYARLQQPISIELSQLQSLLADDEVMIEYFASRDQISAFIITRDRLMVARHLISEAEVAELLQGFQFQLEKFELDQQYLSRYLPRLRASADQYLQQLYDRLIAPIKAQLISRDKTVNKYIIAPINLLHYVPFHALYNGQQYFVEEHDISYVPSLTVYALCCAKQTSSTGPLLIFGLSDLAAPEIKQEVELISELYPGTCVLTEQEATIANLQQYGPYCRILHLATHGVVRPDNPLFSYLKMADGELSFYNTFDLKLQAELVTLSACHTGINKIFPGDELHGLMRGFLYAGTPTMAVSLWAADDRATSELMSNFYRNLIGHKSKRAALCAAQRELIKRWPHPYYWASFVLMGKP